MIRGARVTRGAAIGRGAVLWLAGLDLRLTLLVVPPVIPLIHRDLRLNESGIAALANLPVLTLAVSSMFGGLLTARLGARGAVIAGLWVIAISGALRGLGPSVPMLFAMTIVMGAGIAMIQPAFPALARAWFGTHVALGTGIWANGLLCGEALSASLTIPLVLPLVHGSWQDSFVVWSSVVAITAVIVAFVRDPRDAASGRAVRGTAWLPNFRDRRVWLLGTYQSAASLAYFGANTFFPDYLHATGHPQLVAACLTALNVGQIPASIAVGFIPMRVLSTRATSWFVAALIVAALAGVLTLGGAVTVVSAALLGFTAAYVLTLSFAMPALSAPAAEVPRLAAGTFALGYSISFVTTLLSGAAWDSTHQPAIAFLPMLGAGAIVGLVGPRLARMISRADAPAM